MTSVGAFTYDSNSWNFGTVGNFTYDATLFTSSEAQNKATLTPLDLTSNTQADFDAGTHLGSQFSAGALSLNASTSTVNVWELDPSWAPQYSELIGYWKFDTGTWNGTNGEIIDSSGKGAHGTSSNGAFRDTTRMKLGTGSLTSDGNRGAAQIPNTTDFQSLTAFSMCFWVYPTSHGDWDRLFERKDSTTWDEVTLITKMNMLDAANSYKIMFEVVNSSGSTSYYNTNKTLPLNSWTHLCAGFTGTQMAVYWNGQSLGNVGFTGSIRTSSAAANTLAIGAKSEPWNQSSLSGNIDDFAAWKVALNAEEVWKIYQRQSIRYSGIYTSTVQDAISQVSWPSLSWATSLPFGKELPGDTDANGTPNSESSVQYSAVSPSGENLGSGLEGLWHFNEASCNGTTDEIKDSSGLARHGRCTAGSSTFTPSVFNNGLYLPGDSTTRASISSSVAPNPANAITVSFWLLGRPSHYPAYEYLTGKSDATPSGWQIVTNGNSPVDDIYVRIDTSAGSNQAKYALKNIFDGNYHHITLILDQGNGRWLIDGKTTNTFTYNHGTGFTNTGNLGFGTQWRKSTFDEYAIWSRGLTDAEVLQLYRRGANRNKFQFRTCAQSDCSDAPTWKGPDNSASTWFSELHNMTAVAPTGDGSGNINLLAPVLDFTKWIAAVSGWAFNPDPARYFQYRALMESDDINDLCSSSPCMPDISSVTPVPAVAITTTVGRAFSSALIQFSLTKSGDCGTADDVRFQVSSDDGSTYKYWNGSAWTTVTTSVSYSQASTLSATNSNIGTLASSGTFRFKALVPSQFAKTCELSLPSISW